MRMAGWLLMQIYRRLTIGAHLVLPTRAHTVTTLDLSHRNHYIKQRLPILMISINACGTVGFNSSGRVTVVPALDLSSKLFSGGESRLCIKGRETERKITQTPRQTFKLQT